MPHLIIEYSQNLAESVDIRTLLRNLHDTAEASGVFQAATIRTRGIPLADYVVGVGAPCDAFAHLEARIRPGRTEETQWRLAESLMGTLKAAVLMAQESGLRVGLTVEVTLIPPVRVLYSTLNPDGTIMELNSPATGR